MDDCSPDDTRQVATQRRVSSPLALQLVWRDENGGVSAARNTGWQAAQAELILFIDQDCLAHPDLLASHYRAHTEQGQSKVALVGPIRWSPEYRENPASEYFKATYFPAWDSFEPDGPNWPLFITSNASVSQAGLREMGGFNSDFQHNYEDMELGYRLEQAGYAIKLCPAGLVYHHRPLPIEEMFRRTQVAGREMARLFNQHPALLGNPKLLNPAQALDWGYRLATLDSLLADTLDQLPAPELTEFLPFTSYTGQYLLEHPSLPDNADQLYRETHLAQQTYQNELNRVRWLEAIYQEATSATQNSSWLAKKVADFKSKASQNTILKKPDFEQDPLTPHLPTPNPPSGYSEQTRQLAQRLLTYQERVTWLERLEKKGSREARLQAAIRRPVAPANLNLLYDTLKEYPFALGMREGLQNNFGVFDYADLKAQPLFANLVQRWEQERESYFRAQLARLQAGQTELAAYARQIEIAARG